MAKIYGTMDDLRLENERVQDGRWVRFDLGCCKNPKVLQSCPMRREMARLGTRFNPRTQKQLSKRHLEH